MQLLSNSKADCRDPGESWRVNKALAHFPSSPLGTHRAELGQECPRTGDCTIILRFFFFPLRLCNLQCLACRDGRTAPRWKRNRAAKSSGMCPSGYAELVPHAAQSSPATTSLIWDLPAGPVSAVNILP